MSKVSEMEVILTSETENMPDNSKNKYNDPQKSVYNLSGEIADVKIKAINTVAKV